MKSALDKLPPTHLETLLLLRRASAAGGAPAPAAAAAAPAAPSAHYGRGPGSLSYSPMKRIALACAALLALYAVLCVFFLCWGRGLCFAEQGMGTGGAGSKPVYSPAAGLAIAPAAIALAGLVAPAAVAAVRLQLPWLALAAVALSGTATAFLGVVAAATFALLGSGDVARAAAGAWPALPAATQALSYGGSADALAAAMAGDAAAVGVAALAGALLAGLLSLALLPWARAALGALQAWAAAARAYAAASSAPLPDAAAAAAAAEPPALCTVCCSLAEEAARHDAGGAGGAGEALHCGCFSISLAAPPPAPEAVAAARAAAAAAAEAAEAAAAAAAAARAPPAWRATTARGASNSLLDGVGVLRPFVSLFLRGAPRRGMLGALQTSEGLPGGRRGMAEGGGEGGGAGGAGAGAGAAATAARSEAGEGKEPTV